MGGGRNRTLKSESTSQSLTFKENVVHQDHSCLRFKVLDQVYNLPFGLLLHIAVDPLPGCRGVGEICRKDFRLIQPPNIVQEIGLQLQPLFDEEDIPHSQVQVFAGDSE